MTSASVLDIPVGAKLTKAEFRQELDGFPESVRLAIRNRGLTETFYLARNILGYDKLTVEAHGPLCVFLDTCTCRRRLIQMPRSHFKTTVVTVTKRIQGLLNDPSLRVLIVGDTHPNASKHLLKIKNHYDNNVLFRWLYPERVWADSKAQATAWSQNEIYLPQDINGSLAPHGEPSIDTIGATGGVVSRHYDVINPDDIIAEDEYYSDTEMSKTVDWFTGLESLFVPPVDEGQMDMPSTYWRTDDVYAFAESYFGRGAEAIPTGPFSYQRGDIAVFRRSVRENGQRIFPEGVSDAFLNRLEAENPERYAAQYANNPFDSKLTLFKEEFLRYYEVIHDNEDDGTWVGAISLSDGTRQTFRKDQLFITSFCDPAAGGKNKFRASRAAVITTGVHYTSNRIVILDCWIKRVVPNLIIDEIIRQNMKWMPELFSIEANGLQKMIKFWLDERIERDELMPVPYLPYIPRGDKDGERRIKGLQPLFKAGKFLIRREFSELIEEYKAWPRGSKDGLDCLSQGLDYWQVGYDSVVDEEKLNDYERAVRELRSIATGY